MPSTTLNGTPWGLQAVPRVLSDNCYAQAMATKVDPKNKAKAPKAGFLTIVVDADEYEEALLDPRVHQGNLEATEFLEKLEREGRSL